MAEATAVHTENAIPSEAKKKGVRDRDPVDVHIGYRIRKRRLMLRMPQAALAKRLGVSFRAVQKWEGGAARITVSWCL